MRQVLLYPGEDGYWVVEVPSLPGCISQGRSRSVGSSSRGRVPASACWRIARREDPPPRTFAEVGCRHISRTEQLCNDCVDNDEDGLVDMEDPDCGF